MENNTNPETTQQPGAMSEEKTFTQSDVDRIVGNRVARMKQELEATDTYRRERDEARRELEQYKNNAFLKANGVRDQDMDYVAFKASQMMDDKTDFKQAAEKFLKENPRYAGQGYRVVSTGKPDGGSGTGSACDQGIRKAMGLK